MEEMYNTAARFKKVKTALEGLPLLSIDLVKAAAVDQLVVVTCASWEYYDFLLNWASHLQKIGVTNFLVGACSHHPCQWTDLPLPPAWVQIRRLYSTLRILSWTLGLGGGGGGGHSGKTVLGFW